MVKRGILVQTVAQQKEQGMKKAAKVKKMVKAAKSPVKVVAKKHTAIPGVKPKSADPSAALENHWSKHPVLKTLTALPALVKGYEEARAQAKTADDNKERARGELLTSLQLASISPSDKVACMGFEVFYTKGEKGRVSMERFEQELILRGCPSDVLEGAREAARGEAGVTLQVRPIKALDIDGSKE